MVDLSATYLGLRLSSPLVASASPITATVKSLVELEAAGAGAVVLPSLFEEQLALDAELSTRVDTGNLFVARRQSEGALEEYNAGPAAYAELVRAARKRLRIPVIASLNCTGASVWPEYIGVLAAAGADAIELNVQIVATDPGRSSQAIEDEYVALVQAVVRASTVPVAVKLSPFLTAPVCLAARLEAAGARALVLFQRQHQPSIDVRRVAVDARLERSTPAELGLRLRWLAILRHQTTLSLAATGGVWTGEDAARAVLAGADVVMVASVLLERGTSAMGRLRIELEAALADASLPSISAARGVLAVTSEPGEDRAAFLRAFLGAAVPP